MNGPLGGREFVTNQILTPPLRKITEILRGNSVNLNAVYEISP